MEEIIKKYLSVGSGYGYGDGYGSGSGSGDGYGYGSGSGYGYGSGSGDGYGYGDGDGYGYGSGYGYGDGYGSGYGDGDGSGYGDGYGSGYGDGDGYGYGDGIDSMNGDKLYMVDSVDTFIDSVHGNYAKGRILNEDLTTQDCYIAKVGDYFAHGDTLKQAFDDATEKYENNLPLSERIKRFNERYPDREKKVPAVELFNWHHVLTGSCLMGRRNFCENHGIDYENGMYTVNEFINITRDSYGGNVIRQLEETMPC